MLLSRCGTMSIATSSNSAMVPVFEGEAGDVIAGADVNAGAGVDRGNGGVRRKVGFWRGGFWQIREVASGGMAWVRGLCAWALAWALGDKVCGG